jgi:1,2-diacylglycerol 3-alpha-glucosyltransferase
MRIAMFTDNFYPELGGIQDSVMATARELGRRGDEVLIFAPAASPRDYRRGGLAPGEPDLGPRVEVRRLAAVGVPSSSGQSRLVLPRLGLPAARRCPGLAAFRPEVIHTHTFLAAGWEAVAAARRLGVKLLGTNHWAVAGFSEYAPVAQAATGRLACRAVAGYYNRCAWTSAPSQATLAEMRAHGFTGAGDVLSNPIDTELFHPVAAEARLALKRRLGLTGTAIVHAGRLAPEKHIDVLIRALPALRAAVPEAMLVLAGHGSARAALEALARERGVAAQVRFAGTLTHAALAELFQAADAVAIASTSESQGMALLQAMACGLPAVGARHGPLVEYIPPQTGLLAAPGDAEGFAAALALVLAEPQRRARMGADAALWAQRLGVPAIADAWQDIYARAAHAPGPGRLPAPSQWNHSCA